MPYVTFEVNCSKCGQLFRDRSFSVDASNSLIVRELNRYRRLGDNAGWLCDPCLVATPLSEDQQASHGQGSKASVKSGGPFGSTEGVS